MVKGRHTALFSRMVMGQKVGMDRAFQDWGWLRLRVLPCPGTHLPGAPTANDWCIKAPSFQRNVGQLCRAILTPELPTGSAEAVYEACIIAWLLPQLILLPSPPAPGHSLINVLLRASFLQNLSHICVRGETAHAPQSGFPSPLGAKLGIPKCEKAERAK